MAGRVASLAAVLLVASGCPTDPTPATTTTTRPWRRTTTTTPPPTTTTSSSTSSTTTLQADTTPPSVPSGVTAAARDCARVAVSWAPSIDAGGSGLAGYDVYRDGVAFTEVMAPATAATDSGLAPGTVHTYAVAAVDNAGNRSARSSAVSVNTPPCPGGGAYRWADTFGGPTFFDGVTPQTVAVGRGAVAVAGFFTGSVDLGATRLVSAGGNDIFVAQYDAADGRHAWTRRLGGAGQDFATAVAIDALGNVILAGGFSGTVDFGAGPLTSAGDYDVFVAKFSPAGTLLWVRRLGSTGDDYAKAVALDAAGGVVVTGVFGAPADFGSGTLANAGGYDIFLAALAADGSPMWSRAFGGSGFDAPYGIATTPAGAVLLAGTFAGSVDFGAGPTTSAGGADVFVAEYAGATGSHLWSRRFGGAGEDYLTGAAVDGSGNVLVTGEFSTTIDFGGGPLVNAGAPDVYLAKLSPNGGHLWSERFGADTANPVTATAVAVDASGAVVLSGNLIDALDFGGGPLPFSGSYDPYVVKLSSAGAHLWSKRLSSPSAAYDYSGGVAVDPAGAVFATGSFAGTIDLGGGPVSNAGGLVNRSYDGFLVALGP